MFKLHEMIDVLIQEIDESKRRVAVSYKLTQENPYEKISKLHAVGSVDEAEVVSKNEYPVYYYEDFDMPNLSIQKNNNDYRKLIKNIDSVLEKIDQLSFTLGT